MNSILFSNPPPFRMDSDDLRFVHCKSVLKIPQGGTVFAGEINAGLYLCKISYDKLGATLAPVKPIYSPPQLRCVLISAFPRPQIAKRILFESACFGVECLIFYASQKCDVSYIKSSLYTGEFREHLIRGAEQACSSHIPQFRTAQDIESAIETASSLMPNSIKLAPDPYEATSNFSDSVKNGSSFCVIFGSERGFSNSERDILRNSGFTLASLGPRILRTDSAIIAALAQIPQPGSP